MHGLILPLIAAFGCALCNGIAAVLQKISADKEKQANDLNIGLLFQLFKDKPYIIGVTLDLLGWVLTVYAVQYLPLFLVEALIASNIVVTILVERIFLRGHTSPRTYVATGIILCGLIALAFAASPERAESISGFMRWVIVLSPLALGALGSIAARGQTYGSTVLLAGLSGLAFGMTSVMGRIFVPVRPFWHSLFSPLILGFMISGVLGIWLFSTALQRARASVVNATMTGAQTLIPSLIGILVLGDEPRHGLWPLVIGGTALVLGGIWMLLSHSDN